jgi:hypothetical protein
MMKNGISSSTAKIIAIAAMTINHIGIVFGPLLPRPLVTFCYFIGGATFPVMSYMAAEGYRKTSDKGRYAARLLAFALLSVFPYWLCFRTTRLDVIFTILFGVLALYFSDRAPSSVLQAAIVAAFAFLSSLCDWSVYGVLLIYAMGRIRSDTLRAVLPIAGLFLYRQGANLVDWLAYGAFNAYHIPYYFGCLAAIPVLLLYNAGHRRGWGMKYAFYGYYPAHMLAIYLISLAVRQ